MIARPGFVYVMMRSDGFRKVGWTINVKQRRAILSSHTGIKHQIERVWDGMGDWAAYRVECQVHSELKPHRAHGSFCTEAYDLPLNVIAKTVEGAMRREAECNPPYGLAATTDLLKELNMRSVDA